MKWPGDSLTARRPQGPCAAAEYSIALPPGSYTVRVVHLGDVIREGVLVEEPVVVR